ncbi:ABC transporter substrate-binding protein [Thalassomonas sp. RHCl1]|uniref:substrate-binding periplasmic protein n=1 Tax=Thalassomonas sp. RHCl1 TaxID=2995320 RepID=UPI00248C8EE4|nr:ABC transporter substrate-binding protein [Thalassomonas sp. RHCl1]
MSSILFVHKILALSTFIFSVLTYPFVNEEPGNNNTEQVITILALDIPGLHNPDGRGAYDVIIKKVLAGQFAIDIQPLPPKRSLVYFDRCEHCCFSPGNTDGNFYNFSEEVRETEPMAVAKIFIFSDYGREPFRHLSELEGKEVGIRLGMPLSHNIIESIDKKKFNVQYAASLEANLTRLKLGRVEAALGWFPDSDLLFAQNKMKPYPHNKAFPVAVHHDALACKGVPERFFQVFNQGIQALRASGELQRLIGPSYAEPQ